MTVISMSPRYHFLSIDSRTRSRWTQNLEHPERTEHIRDQCLHDESQSGENECDTDRDDRIRPGDETDTGGEDQETDNSERAEIAEHGQVWLPDGPKHRGFGSVPTGPSSGDCAVAINKALNRSVDNVEP